VPPATEAQQPPVGGGTLLSPKAGSQEGARPAAMTAKEKKRACAQFFAAQDKRRRGAKPVGVFWRQWIENDQHFENFLRDYPFLRNDIPQSTQAGIAE